MTKFKKVALVVVSALILVSMLLAQGVRYFYVSADSGLLDVDCKSAVLMDYNTGSVVYTKNELQHLPIASMVKIMTLNIIFDKIEEDCFDINTDITASANATSMGGSQAFLDTNSTYKAGELIKSIIVASANDSCVAMAEYISGSVEEFVVLMNNKAESLGMENTNFANCTGLPCVGQYSCAFDVATMTQKLLQHKEFYEYSKIWMFDFVHPSGRITSLSNTNKLIRGYEGCDGGKTGFTNEAMFCLSATAMRGNTRLISVTMGASSSKIRNAQNAKLFNYGFANYETKLVINSDEFNLSTDIVGGKQDSLDVVAEGDLYYFGLKSQNNFTTSIELNEIEAPIKKGDIVGNISAYSNGEYIGEVKMLAGIDVDKKDFKDIIDSIVKVW